MAPPILTISTARQKFFDLFEAVTSHRGRKIIITSRGAENHAVLIGEAYLNELESAAKKLKDIESGKLKSPVNFKLMGSGRIATGNEDPLAEIRAEDSLLWNKKLASLHK